MSENIFVPLSLLFLHFFLLLFHRLVKSHLYELNMNSFPEWEQFLREKKITGKRRHLWVKEGMEDVHILIRLPQLWRIRFLATATDVILKEGRKSQKKSHLKALRAKRATFTFVVDKS